MARIAHCIDPEPLSDGSCQTVAWIEQGGIADMLPTPAQAASVGVVFLGSLVMIAFAVRAIKPQKGN